MKPIFENPRRIGPRLLLTGLLATSLSACYESEVRVLNFGDEAKISGTFSCAATDGSQPTEAVTITERVTGSGDKVDHVYSFEGGGSFRFSSLDNGMFLGQTERGYQGWGKRARDARFAFVYLDVRGRSGFSFYETDFEPHQAAIGKSMDSHEVKFKINPHGRTKTMTLKGSPDALFDFFNSHARFMLKESVVCSAQS